MTGSGFGARSFALLLLVASGCGLEVGNPKKPGNGIDDSLPLSVRDSEATSAQLDEAFSAVQGEENRAASLRISSLKLLPDDFDLVDGGNDEDPDLNLAATPLCDPKDGKATVSSSDSRARQGEWRRQGRTMRVERTDSLELTNVFSSDTAVGCLDGSRPDIRWDSLNSLRQETHFVRKKSRQVDLPIDFSKRMASGKTDERKGVRVVEFGSPRVAGTSRIFKKSVTFNVEHKLTLSGKGNATLTSTLASQAPFEIEVEWAAGAFVRKTLLRGSQVATHGDGSRVEMSFENLLFTAASRCAPDSGTVRGAIYEPDGVTQRETFVATFQAGVGTVVYGKSGDTDEYIDDCL